MYREDEYLQLSGIQHFCFCKRQWALIAIEQAWADDARTAAGNILHENADNPFFNEKRNGTIISRSIPVSSSKLGLNGICDVVEFVQNDRGVTIGVDGQKYKIYPIEYKIGHRKKGEWDKVQLCAEAIALEEFFKTNVDIGYIYYESEKRRNPVEINDELRNLTYDLASEMHKLYSEKITPKAMQTAACKKCSLFDLCMPSLGSASSIEEYLNYI